MKDHDRFNKEAGTISNIAADNSGNLFVVNGDFNRLSAMNWSTKMLRSVPGSSRVDDIIWDSNTKNFDFSYCWNKATFKMNPKRESSLLVGNGVGRNSNNGTSTSATFNCPGFLAYNSNLKNIYVVELLRNVYWKLRMIAPATKVATFLANIQNFNKYIPNYDSIIAMTVDSFTGDIFLVSGLSNPQITRLTKNKGNFSSISGPAPASFPQTLLRPTFTIRIPKVATVQGMGRIGIIIFVTTFLSVTLI